MYKNVSQMAQETGLCKAEARNKIRAMQLSGLYPAEAFLVKPLRVDEDAFLHFNVYQSLIEEGTTVAEWSGTWREKSETN